MQREPQRFGKYLLLDRISVGGMAEVFKAKAFGVEGFEKILAIKRILPNMVEDSDFIEMFIDEAKIAGQLNHANICQIFELGRYEKAHYIAMEYISGKDLLQITGHFFRQRQPVPIPVACFIVSKLCEGLDYAHRKRDTAGNPLNIIHRDVSPQNVLVSYEGEVKLIDFGIAKARYRSSKTAAGVLKGKFGYMSPEQVRGLRLDRRTDVFSLGTLLFEMVTGTRLFGGDTDFAVLEKVRNGDITPPSRLNPQIKPAFEAVILRALAKTPEDRYQWANELQEDLQGMMLQHQPLMTTKRLSAFMKEQFSEDIRRERAEHERYLSIGVGGVSVPPPPPPPDSRALPDFDAYDDDEETALMKERAGEMQGEPPPVPPGAVDPHAHMAALAERLPEGGGEATVILWSDEEDEGAEATMILPDDGASLPSLAAYLPARHPGFGDPDAPPEGATMILPDGVPPEGATMILSDGEDIVDGISLSQVRRMSEIAPGQGAAPQPTGPAFALPADLPAPRQDDDPFGLRLPGAAPEGPVPASQPTAPSVTTDTARTRREQAKRASGGGGTVLRLVAVGLVAAILGGLVVGLVVGGGGTKERPAEPTKTAVTVLVRAEADVAVTVNGQDRHQTGEMGAVLLLGLPSGQHELALGAKGFRGKTVTFELEPGQVRLVGPYALERLAEPAPKAELVVQVSEMFRDAEITLGEQLVPSAKLGKPLEIPAGKPLELRVSLLGYEDYVEEIRAEKGQKVETKQIALAEDELGQVSVASTPLGAQIWVNGTKQPCVTPCRVKQLNPKKKFKLKLAKEGYRVHEASYGFPPSERTRILVVSLTELASRGDNAGQTRDQGAFPPGGESALSQR